MAEGEKDMLVFREIHLLCRSLAFSSVRP
jgi:hypothetical protein